MRVTVETQRMVLRPMVPEDYEEAFQWCGDPKVNTYMIYPLYHRVEDVRAWLEGRNGDDPDNYDHSSDAPQRQGNQQQRPQQQTGTRGSGAGSQKPATLSDAQMVRLYKKAEAVGMSQDACVARIKTKYGHDNPANMTRQQYDEICAALDAAAAKKGQGGDDNAQ